MRKILPAVRKRTEKYTSGKTGLDPHDEKRPILLKDHKKIRKELLETGGYV